MKKFFANKKNWIAALLFMSASSNAQKGDAYEMSVSGVKSNCRNTNHY